MKGMAAGRNGGSVSVVFSPTIDARGADMAADLPLDLVRRTLPGKPKRRLAA